MQTQTINREDWTGKKESVRIHKDGSFSLMGYTFRLIRRPEQEEADCFLYVAEIHGEGWDSPLGGVTRYYRDSYYTALDGDLARDDKDPILAAAKLLCSLI